MLIEPSGSTPLFFFENCSVLVTSLYPASYKGWIKSLELFFRSGAYPITNWPTELLQDNAVLEGGPKIGNSQWNLECANPPVGKKLAWKNSALISGGCKIPQSDTFLRGWILAIIYFCDINNMQNSILAQSFFLIIKFVGQLELEFSSKCFVLDVRISYMY